MSWVSMKSRYCFLSILLSTNIFLSACGGGFSQPAATTPVAPTAGTTNSQATRSSDWPNFIYPQPGDPNADVSQRISWTATNNARAYELQIGTTLGGNDVFDSGLITTTSVAMPRLPAGVMFHARVRAILNGWADDVPVGHWSRGAYTRFRTDDQTAASALTNVAADRPLPAGAPLEWSVSPLAVGYRIIVNGASFGTNGGAFTVGANDDSGLIHTTHIFLYAPPNGTVSATLETIYLTRTVSSQLTFTVAGGAPSFADKYALGKKLTAEVRAMADRDNQPYGGTVLDDISDLEGVSAVSCGEFRAALQQVINEARTGLGTRALNIGLQNNAYDTHTLVEVLDDTTGRWLTLDPTFGLVSLRSDGSPATAAEISASARAQDWTALQFEFLTAAVDLYVRDYYIDYPLLYLNILTSGSGVQDPPASLAPYFDALPLPVAGRATYSLQCASGESSATADLDDATEVLSCDGPDQLTPTFLASSIKASAATSNISAWRLRRFTF
jgi:hypothetical protein